MRDILFKAKRVDNGEWVEGYIYKIQDMAFIFPAFTNGSYNEQRKFMIFINPCFEVISETICQYTGLTDKNGNKIWENDLVGVLTEDGNFKVTWSDTEARYKMESESDCFTVTFDEYWSYEVEVVGNVFDTLWTR